MARQTLYLIDGHAQIYRAYYAPFPPLNAPSGEPTRAIHVFMQMLLGLLRDRKPDYLVMAMDTPAEGLFRRQIDAAYKATREKMPEDLPLQIERIVAILTAMKIPVLRQPGFEADDLLATLSHRHAGQELDIYLVSRDKDLDQLLGEQVQMYDPGKDREINAAAIVEEKGYGPEQAIEAQMLIGDNADNIRGVEGIGPKRAAQLLKQYGSLAEIIAHAGELPPKLRDKVQEFQSRAETVRQLVTLRRDVPVDFELSQAEVSQFSPASAAAIFTELGLTRLLERVGATPDATVKPVARTTTGQAAPSKPRKTAIGETASLFDTDTPHEEEEPESAAPSHSTPTESTRFGSTADYQLIDTESALAALAKKLATIPALAFDTETTGLCPATAALVGLSISHEAGTGYYIAVRGIGRTVNEEAVRRYLGPIFENPRIRKCGQNVKFDMIVLKAIGIEVAGVDFDTMLASFVLDSGRPSHGLDALARDLLHYHTIPITDLIGRGSHQLTMDQVSTDRVCVYAAEDADIAWRLRGVLERQLVDPELTSLFRNVEMPLLEVLARMEFHGVAVDTHFLHQLSNQLAERLGELEHDIYHAAGHPFNINSPKQLAVVLFDENKMRVVKETKTARSTDAEVLETLAAETDHPVPRLVLEHRELAKLKGTYVDALPKMVSSHTGRIHPSFHQTGAITGRLSCSDPNLQNIPIRTELGAQIRRAFVPGHPRHVLLKADYSQIELRVLAHFSGDEALATAFREDRDIHAFVAAQIEGVPLEQVTKQQRGRAKTVNFGIIYGQSAFGLARQTGMSVGQARDFIDRYFQRYPRIRAFMDECIAHARRHGYVKTLLGRRRAIPDINSHNQALRSAAERLAVNTAIQGTAADLIKQAMINIDHRIVSENRPGRMLIQVHDELVFEIPEDCIAEEARMIAEEMSGALQLKVPIRVDVGWGKNWLEPTTTL